MNSLPAGGELVSIQSKQSVTHKATQIKEEICAVNINEENFSTEAWVNGNPK